MARFVALVATALSIGAIYSITALGFLVVYKATGVVNFAHGDLMTLGAYVALWAAEDQGMAIVAAYLVALVVLFGVGVAFERAAYAPLRGRSSITVVIATLGFGLALRAGIGLWQGADTKRLASPVGQDVFHIAGAAISYQRTMALVTVMVVVAAVFVLFQRTTFGRELRALAADHEAAELMGIRTARASMMVFGLSASLAALGGILIAPMLALNLNLGFSVLLGGFAAAILGGFGSLRGVVMGAMLIGFVEHVVGGYVLTEYRSVFPFVVMILVIAWRPQGLLGAAGHHGRF